MAVAASIGALVRRERARARLLAALVPLAIATAIAPNATESAAANGDTRTIELTNAHTNESGSFTYMVDGAYDSAVLDKLNWFLRDWRLNEQTKMDPKLFDILWEVYRESGSKQPVDVLSAYRSPHTNAMLRRRSRLVAKYSQHMEGKAIDAHFVDVGTGAIRDVAMRMQAGGVGFYPTGATPWVHIDSGSVRYWPPLSRAALTRLFPDGKTVFIPADGQPMPGYEQARAEIEARGGDVVVAQAGGANGNPLSWLFGARAGGADDEEESSGAEAVVAGRGAVGRGGASAQVATVAADPVAAAKRNLPQGETFVQPADGAAPASSGETADNADGADPVSLRGPIAAQFIAPLPPRRPADLAPDQFAVDDAPTPPARPAEFAFGSLASQASGEPGQGGADLIAALLRHGKLPSAITRGVDAAPAEALALTDTAAAEPLRTHAMLARAAALDAPLPPVRPTPRAAKAAASDDSSAQPRQLATPVADVKAAARATRSLAALSVNDAPRADASPYGGLDYNAFKAAPTARAPDGLADLRGAE